VVEVTVAVFVHELCRRRLLKRLRLGEVAPLDSFCRECRARFEAAVSSPAFVTLDLIAFA
jgi:hypothetical protein